MKLFTGMFIGLGLECGVKDRHINDLYSIETRTQSETNLKLRQETYTEERSVSCNTDN